MVTHLIYLVHFPNEEIEAQISNLPKLTASKF